MRPLDEQQAKLLERLRAARGAPVSFAELRSEGIENPALLCYELEVAGLRIVRVQRDEASGRTASVGVRLEEPEPIEQPPRARASPTRGATGRAATPRSRPGRLWPVATAHLVRLRERACAAVERSARRLRARLAARSVRRLGLVAALALIAAAALGATIGLTDRPAGRGRGWRATTRAASRARPGTRGRASRAPHPGVPRASDSTGGQKSSGARGAHRARKAPVSPVTAARLQLTGHEMLDEGRFADAIRFMRAALDASGQSLARCTEPATQACLIYAYALYDLGRALRLRGDPGAAVPILRERLRIDNQRATVRWELEQARRQLHTAASGPPSG